MATAIDSGLLGPHWSGSLLDLTASRQDKVEQYYNILLKLGWQTEASRFCDKSVPTTKNQPPNGQCRGGPATGGSESSRDSENSCEDASFLVELFNAIQTKDYQESIAENSKSQYPSGFPSKIPHPDLNLLRPRNFFGGSYPRLRMADTDDSSKRVRRRQCHSESELSPEVELGSKSVKESIRQFLPLATLNSCFNPTANQSVSLIPNGSSETHAHGDLIDSVNGAGKERTESPDMCKEAPQPVPIVTAVIDEEPIESTDIQQQLKTNCQLKSSLEEPLTLPQEGFHLQDDSPSSCDERQSFYSPQSTISNQSSSTKLIKSVSFADDLGKSLTEVFEFDSTADNSPDYHTDMYEEHYDRTKYGVIRKPKVEGKVFPGRFSRSRARNRTSGCYGDYCFSSDPPENRGYTPPPTGVATAAQGTRVSSDKQAPTIYVWNTTFQQPATKYYEFRQKVENNAVSLENISVANVEGTCSDQQLPNLSGTIKVLNLAYQKQVWLRITIDSWQTFTEHQATYSQLLSGGHLQTPTRFDAFTFQISSSELLEPLSVSPDRIKDVCRIEFAIRYSVEDGGVRQYWDNNEGKNYILERSERTPDPINLGPQWAQLSPPSSRRDSHNSYCFSDYRTTVDDVSGSYTAEYLPNFSGVTSFTNYRVWSHFADETVYY